jgi:hypothetical protein
MVPANLLHPEEILQQQEIQGSAATTEADVSVEDRFPSETNEVLAGLRNGWLSDFETGSSRPVPRRAPRATIRLRAGVEALADGFRFWFESGRRLACSVLSRNDASQLRTEPIRSVSERVPIVPSGSPTPPVHEGIVVDLRDGWLADIETTPERHTPRPISWQTKVYREIEPVTGELGYWLDCMKELCKRLITPRTKAREVARGERARRAEAAARFVSATIVIALATGTVLYVAAVVHILDPRRLAQVLGQ